MAFANVFLGNVPGDGTGDDLRVAFNKINNNFANLAAINGNANVVVYATGNARVTATYNPGVESIVGTGGVLKRGNVVLQVADVIGAASIAYVNAKFANVPQGGGGNATSIAWGNITGKPTFASIATTGSWNNLLNIPSNVINAVTQANINLAVNPVNANVTAANLKITNLISSTNTLAANASVQATAIDTISANLGAYQTWANTYSQAGAVDTLIANASAQALSISLLTANAAGQAEQIVTLAANAGVQATAIDDLGSFYTYANINYNKYTNADVASYLNTATINTTGNVTAGNVRSNGNIVMTSNVARNVYVNSYAPAPTQGNVGDIWYQTY